MKPPARIITISWNYNRAEIVADGVVHAVGAALAIAGATVLLTIAFRSAPGAEIASVGVYVVGLIAAAGMALKLFWPGRFDRLSIAFYLLLGWSGILAYEPVAAAVRPMTLWMIVIGGVLYSIGVVFHVWQRLRFHTAIWYGFVVTAALVHYVAVLSCVP